ncbi:hypothetical protein ACSQ67_011658 [Phaseolus vulgaris]
MLKKFTPVSLMAITSRGDSLRPCQHLKKFLPILPNPFMATFSFASTTTFLYSPLFPTFKNEVVMISVACLIALFSVQKYGTSKVGLAVGPALFIWFCSLVGIGIYNLVKYDSSVLRAFNPIHIYYFFARNSTKAWYSLGGCLLCATDRVIQTLRLCLQIFAISLYNSAYICICCFTVPTAGFLGQAAYLMENHADAGNAFYSSVPSGAFWPTFLIANIAALIASRAMTTATFSCIKQSAVLGCLPHLKIVHTSLWDRQIYFPVINWFLLAVSLVFVCTISSVDEIGNAYVPMVPQSERFLFRRVCQRSYHIFRFIARPISLIRIFYIFNRYGYKDVRKENHQTFEQLLMESLEKFIDTNIPAPNFEASTSEDANPESPKPPVVDAEESLERELSFIRKAKESGVVMKGLGKTHGLSRS